MNLTQANVPASSIQWVEAITREGLGGARGRLIEVSISYMLS
jgi:hypothetical protein